MATVGSLKRISASKLATMLSADVPHSIAVVDVRDDDHIGGHIKGSLHYPSRSFDAMLPSLLRNLQYKPVVVFHCALSQQRGPSAALQYMRARELMLHTQGGDTVAAQDVYVLDRGFVGWQETYGTNEQLTDNYRKEIWQDGY